MCIFALLIKNNNMAEVNFTIGDGFGKMLYNLAVEKVLEGMNPEAGIKTITEGLIGCPVNYAISVLKGDIFLDVENENVILIDNYDELSHPYTPRSIDAFVKSKSDYYMQQIEDWKPVLAAFRESFTRDNVFLMEKMSASKIFQYFMGEAEIEELFENADDNVIVNTKYIAQGVQNCLKLVMDWVTYLRKVHKMLDVDTTYHINAIETQAASLQRCINQIYEMCLRPLERTDSDLVTRFLDSTHQIDEALSTGIKPVNIEDKYDACWIAPDGTTYGLNGEYANMLHNIIADALIDAGIVSYESDEEKKYGSHFLLEKRGFVKVHHDNVLFSGYDDSIRKSMTAEQVKQLIKYGNNCYGGKLFFDYDKKFCSTAKLGSMEPLMYRKLFDFC